VDIRAEIQSAIAEPDFLKMLSAAFAKQITDNLKKDIEEVQAQGAKTEKRVDDLEITMDDHDQEKRSRNIIVSGILPEQSKTKEEMRKLLNDKLNCNIAPTDISYTLELKLGTNENGGQSVRVAFSNNEKKKQVMSQRKKLKDNNRSMWITDDLTPYRNELAYLSRQAVHGNHTHQTWVSAGKVFIKKTASAKPIKVRSPSDIPGYKKLKD
jgi:hypothetical protein